MGLWNRHATSCEAGAVVPENRRLICLTLVLHGVAVACKATTNGFDSHRRLTSRESSREVHWCCPASGARVTRESLIPRVPDMGFKRIHQ